MRPWSCSGTQPQTLYANVSRGRIRAPSPDPDDSRAGASTAPTTSGAWPNAPPAAAGRMPSRPRRCSGAIRSCAPAFLTVAHGRLLYRGHDVRELADTATLEDIAALFWQAPCELPLYHPWMAAA